MIVLECCRLIFYLIEWIWTTVVLGIFRDKLIITEELTNGETSPACLFNLNLGTSRCDFGVSSVFRGRSMFSPFLYLMLEHCFFFCFSC